MNDSSSSLDPRQMARMLVCGVALVLALGGQVALQTMPQALGLGLALSAAGLALFLWGALYPSARVAALVGRSAWLPLAALIALATCLSILAAAVQVVFDRQARADYTPVVALWLGSAAAYVAAFCVNWRGWTGWRARLTKCRVELIALGLLTLAAAVARFAQLGALPRVIDGDEGKLGQAALLTTRFPLSNPFALFENFGGVYLQAINQAIRVWGHTPFALRVLPAIGGTLAIPALYLLARRLFGPRVAFTAALLLAVSHAHIHFSRIVSVGYIQGTFLIPLELYFLYSGLENRSALRLALGGLLLGFHLSVYVSAQIMLAYILAYLLVLVLFYRQWARYRLLHAMAFWYGVALVALPEVVYGVRQPGEFMARLNADGTFQSGWLAQTVAQTGQSAAHILLGRVAHAFLTLNHYPTLDFYGAPAPLLDLITGLLFLLGLVYALWRTRDRRFLLLNGYFWSATLAVGLFASPPESDSYRMLIVLPAAMALAAVGWEQVMLAFGLTADSRRAAWVAVSALILACVGWLNWQTYTTGFLGQCRHGGDQVTRFSSYMGSYLRTLDRETTVYLLSGDGFQYGTHPSTDFLSNNKRVTNWPRPVEGLALGANSSVIAAPSRADELRRWALERTDGRLHRVDDCEQLILLAFRVP